MTGPGHFKTAASTTTLKAAIVSFIVILFKLLHYAIKTTCTADDQFTGGIFFF
jgi:hypothetical protein